MIGLVFAAMPSAVTAAVSPHTAVAVPATPAAPSASDITNADTALFFCTASPTESIVVDRDFIALEMVAVVPLALSASPTNFITLLVSMVKD